MNPKHISNYSTTSFPKKNSNHYLPLFKNSFNVYSLESYKSFFILNNLTKKNEKFRYLLKNIISEPLFLIYAYKTLNQTNKNISYDLISKNILNGINTN